MDIIKGKINLDGATKDPTLPGFLKYILMSLVGLGKNTDDTSGLGRNADDPSDDIPRDPWCLYTIR